MNARVVISIANLVAIVVVFVVLFEFSQYANYAFYALILWMIVGFVLLYAARPRVPSASADPRAGFSPFPSSSPPSTAPLPTSEPSGGIGFCIYCAAPIAPGTSACPACGHAVPRW